MKEKKLLQGMLSLLLMCTAVTANTVPAAAEESGFGITANETGIEADENGNAVLEVNLQTENEEYRESVALQWYEVQNVQEEETLIKIDGETSETLNLSGITEEKDYKCVGTGEDGSESSVYIHVYPTAAPEEPADSYSGLRVWTDGETDIYADPG